MFAGNDIIEIVISARIELRLYNEKTELLAPSSDIDWY